MDSFDTVLDISELFKPDPLPSLAQGSRNSVDGESYLLVDADAKWNYGGYCVVA